VFERQTRALDVSVAGALLAAQFEASDRHWRIDTLERKRSELERKRLLLELEVQQALLEAVLRSVPVGIIIYDREMRVLGVNAEYSRLAQTSARQPCDPLPCGAALSTAIDGRACERLLAGEAVYEEDVRYEAPGGATCYADFHFRPVFDLFGSVIAVVGTAIDVSARHESGGRREKRKRRALRT
jgi:PAS domain-containing protein